MAATTQHAKKRAKRRMGYNVGPRFLEKVLQEGYSQKNTTGSLKRYLHSFGRKYKRKPVIYDNMIYLFTSQDVLITMYEITESTKKLIKEYEDGEKTRTYSVMM